MENRRQHFRYFFTPDKRLEVELGSTNQDPAPFARLVNLSLGGMYFQLKDAAVRLSVGQTVSASFTLPGSTVPLTMACEILHTQEKESVACYGCKFLMSENPALKNIQEKVLWQFLSEQQRLANQMRHEGIRLERMQIDRFLKLLNNLFHTHAAVARARSNFTNVVLGLMLGLIGASSAALYLIDSNRQSWERVLKEHRAEKYVEAPDFEAQVPLKDVEQRPPSTYDVRKKAAEDERAKEIQRRKNEHDEKMKTLREEYRQHSTSPTETTLISFSLGAILFLGLWGYLHRRKPVKVERLQNDLRRQIKAIVDKYPMEVETWGGARALEVFETVEKQMAILEEKKAKLLES